MAIALRRRLTLPAGEAERGEAGQQPDEHAPNEKVRDHHRDRFAGSVAGEAEEVASVVHPLVQASPPNSDVAPCS